MGRSTKPATVRNAERQLAEAQFAIKAHRKHCSRCHNALNADYPARACDLGWSYLKLERRAAKRLRDVLAAADATTARQLALW